MIQNYLYDLLEQYSFNSEHLTSCSVILQKFYNNTIEHYSIVNDEQTKVSEMSEI